MGFILSKLMSIFKDSKKIYKMLIIGIQNAGKTSLLYRLSINESVVTTPTIGSNVEEIKFNNLNFQAFDLGGQENMRSLWDAYYTNVDVRNNLKTRLLYM